MPSILRPALRLLPAVGLLLVPLLALGWLALAPGWADDTPTPDAEERAERIALQVEKGWKAFQTGNHEEALARMKRLAELDPEHTQPPYLGARVHERLGEYVEALALVEPAHERRPDDRPLEALRFDLLLDTGRVSDAEHLARRALAERADDLVARTVLGTVL